VFTIEEFGRKLRRRELSAAEATDDCLRRIEADNARLNAFIHVMADEARRQATEADREIRSGLDRGPLHGVPLSIKDLFDIKGVATTAASRVRAGHVADRDAPVITHLRQAGAVLLGKTNLHEFAFGTTNEDSAYGPARNPLDVQRSPGGSSGGSAVSIVSGMALASLGTDTGGSIRIPAAACGTVGLKPAYGEVTAEGAVPLSRTLDHVGPLTQTVSDAWHMFNGVLGRSTSSLTARPVGDLRFAVLRPYFCDILDDGVRASFEAALDGVRRAHAHVDETAIPHASAIVPVYMNLSFGDAAAYHAATLETMADLYTRPVRLRLELARYVTAEDYVRALKGREVLRREVDAALSGYDALLLPTLPIPAPIIGASSVEIGGSKEPVRALMLRLTQLFNLTGHPVVSVPCGTTPGGLPVGLQVVGRQGQTDALLQVAATLEQVLGVRRGSDPRLTPH